MSVSTDGLIFFGWLFDNGHEFPWDSEREDGGDWTSWWRKIGGCPQPRDEDAPYDKGGNPKPGVTEADTDAFWAMVIEWEKAHPMPFEIVNYCSCDYPMYAIAFKSSVKAAARGTPRKISICDLPAYEGIDRFKSTLKKLGIVLEGEPAWYLASYWG